MTDIDAKKLLLPEEIAALLHNGQNEHSPLITAVLDTGKTAETGAAVAEKVNQALLGNYLAETRIDFCGYSTPQTDSPYLCARLDNGQKNGYVFFSAGFVRTVINRIFNRHNTVNEADKKLTPAIAAVMQEIADIICRCAAGQISSQKTIWNCHSLSETLPDILSAQGLPLCFSLDNNKMWLLPPETEDNRQKAPQNKINSLENAAQDLPVEATAVVNRQEITLRKLSQWHQGDFLPLGIEKNAEISILCGNKTIFKGILGQKLHRIAVKITKRYI